jgi:hypothetical protein
MCVDVGAIRLASDVQTITSLSSCVKKKQGGVPNGSDAINTCDVIDTCVAIDACMYVMRLMHECM